MSIRLINFESLPCWYELSWQKLGTMILLRVHEDFIKHAGNIPADYSLVAELQQNFSFVSFAGSFDKDFGFSRSFIRREKNNGFVTFAIPVPLVRKLTGKPCEICGDIYDVRKGLCLFCGGVGKGHTLDWPTAFAISASFTVFFSWAQLFQKITSAKRTQLFTVETAARSGMNGGSLSGTYSIPLTKWLGSREIGKNIPELIEAMSATYQRLFGPNFAPVADELQAYVADKRGWLNVIGPHRCSLCPSETTMMAECGYDFTCHNVDSPMQQLVLLAGLSALHDLARREGVGTLI